MKRVSVFIFLAVIFSGCAQIKYPVIGGNQPATPLSKETMVITTDMCPLAMKDPGGGGIYSSIKRKNQQILWKWVCADLPFINLQASVDKYAFTTEQISSDLFNEATSTQPFDFDKLEKIANKANSKERFVVFVKLDPEIYVGDGYNSITNIVKAFLYDRELKKISFAFADSRRSGSTSRDDTKSSYTGLFNSVIDTILGNSKLPPPTTQAK